MLNKMYHYGMVSYCNSEESECACLMVVHNRRDTLWRSAIRWSCVCSFVSHCHLLIPRYMWNNLCWYLHNSQYPFQKNEVSIIDVSTFKSIILTKLSLRLIRLTSPNLNHIIAIGAIILYLGIYLFVVPTSNQVALSVLCNVKKLKHG